MTEDSLFNEGRRLKLNLSDRSNRVVSESICPDKKLPKSFMLIELTVKTIAAMSAFPKVNSQGRLRLDEVHFGEDDRNVPRHRFVLGLKSSNWTIAARPSEVNAALTPTWKTEIPQMVGIHWTFHVVMTTPFRTESLNDLEIPAARLSVRLLTIDYLFLTSCPI